MARDETAPSRPLPPALARPQVSLLGRVDEAMADSFLTQLRDAEKQPGDIAVEITTQGGDPELARRMILEVDAARARGRRLLLLGKTEVYSAGVTFMAAFPREDRYLTDDATLLIHCRQLDKTVELSGPIRSSIPEVKALLQQLEQGVTLEVANFNRLIEGSDIALAELTDKALFNWYVPSGEALTRGLVAGVVTAADLAGA